MRPATMTQRERFLATAECKSVDRAFLLPTWIWPETVGRWQVDGLRSFEIAARCDHVACRKTYGKNLVVQDGIDKRELAKGPEAIDREVLSKVPWLCLQGGYFPQVDHLVPPDVSLENFRHYARLVRAVVEDPERYLPEAKRRGWWQGWGGGRRGIHDDRIGIEALRAM